jgi:hypothetical protein
MGTTMLAGAVNQQSSPHPEQGIPMRVERHNSPPDHHNAPSHPNEKNRPSTKHTYNDTKVRKLTRQESQMYKPREGRVSPSQVNARPPQQYTSPVLQEQPRIKSTPTDNYASTECRPPPPVSRNVRFPTYESSINETEMQRPRE